VAPAACDLVQSLTASGTTGSMKCQTRSSSERVGIFTKVGPAEEVITALVQPDWRPILTYIEAAGMHLNVTD
jgi:hypothetical protein